MQINTLETLKIIVENSNTWEELEEVKELLKQKKRWIRRLSLNLSSDLESILFANEDQLDQKGIKKNTRSTKFCTRRNTK